MKQNEVYLIDLVRLLIRQWRIFLVLFAAVLALALVFLLFAKRQWEAVAWIEVGQVGAAGAQDPKVEPFQRVIERLQMVPFQNGVLKSAGFDRDAPEARLYRNSFGVEPLPYANLIRIRLRANSRELAEKLALDTVAGLKGAQKGIEANLMNLAHAHLDSAQADLKDAQAERDLLRQAATSGRSDVDGKNVSSPALANMLLVSKDSEIRGLKHARSDLLEKLGPTYTFETSMPWPVYLPEKQASPNVALTLGIGLFAGLIAGAFGALARDAMRRSTERPA